MTVSLQNYASVSLSKDFDVTITCLVNTVTFQTPPAAILIEPGITTQPVNSAFMTTQSPNCGNPVSFTWVSAPPSFISLTGILSFSGAVQATGATLSNLGVNSLTLRATVDGKTKDAIFNVEVANPCRRAILQSANELAPPLPINM
jgi:hypothetical protein